MSTKKITIQLEEQDVLMLRRVAKEVKRKEQDMYQLMFAYGVKFMFCDEQLAIDKQDDEYTEEEKAQLEKNEKLELEYGHKLWHKSKEEREELGYKSVDKYIRNHQPSANGMGCTDPLLDPIADRVEAFAL